MTNSYASPKTLKDWKKNRVVYVLEKLMRYLVIKFSMVGGIGKSFRDIVIVVTVKSSKAVRPTAFIGTSDNHGCCVSI